MCLMRSLFLCISVLSLDLSSKFSRFEWLDDTSSSQLRCGLVKGFHSNWLTATFYLESSLLYCSVVLLRGSYKLDLTGLSQDRDPRISWLICFTQPKAYSFIFFFQETISMQSSMLLFASERRLPFLAEKVGCFSGVLQKQPEFQILYCDFQPGWVQVGSSLYVFFLAVEQKQSDMTIQDYNLLLALIITYNYRILGMEAGVVSEVCWMGYLRYLKNLLGL